MPAAISGGAVLVLLVLSLVFLRGRLSTVKPPVARQAAVTYTQAPAVSNVNVLKPSPSTKLTPARQPAASDSDPATDSAVEQVADAPQVQSQMMSDQLATPARISHAIDPKAAEEAPPTTRISASGMEGVSPNGAIGSVFSGQGAKVRGVPPKVVTISAGVAVGLLIQRTAPVYPPIAKAARIEGRVLLKATISPTGIIKDVQVVSGPPMLRQSAVDAVRTWRYKPYKLDNQPVDAETTVEVVFSLLG
jgi:protein TonB